MRILIASPIGATRRVLENWLTPLGHKLLCAETFDSLSRQLSANPSIELIITEWQLGGQTALDVLKKTQQITHISDSAETTNQIKLLVMTTPDCANARQSFQMDALKASDQVTFVEKPINRDTILKLLVRLVPEPPRINSGPVTVQPQMASVAKESSQTAENAETKLLRATVTAQQEALQFLAKLHTAAQQKLQEHVSEK